MCCSPGDLKFKINFVEFQQIMHWAYDTLKIEVGSTMKEVRSAFRKLCLQLHPVI